MVKMKGYKFEDLLKESLRSEDFKHEYDVLEEEFVLAKEVMELRKTKNLTQKDLAILVGTSQPAIARLESGIYKNVSLSFIRRVAKALDAIPEIHLKKA